MEKRGQPKRFNSAKELINLFMQFCDYIIAGGYTIIPSQTEFCKWLSKNFKNTDRRTIYNSLNKYFPDIKKEFEGLQSDLIAQGGMVGKYQSAMSIFVLKNWCRWEDHPQRLEPEDDQQKEAHRELIEAIKGARNADK